MHESMKAEMRGIAVGVLVQNPDSGLLL